MALIKRYNTAWHVGETATPFRLDIRNADGSANTQVVSATFTLINRDTGVTIIAAAACQSITGGVLLYYPGVGELVACRFLAQFTAALTGGSTLPTDYIEGEILPAL
jgi:hypothetical protein